MRLDLEGNIISEKRISTVNSTESGAYKISVTSSGEAIISGYCYTSQIPPLNAKGLLMKISNSNNVEINKLDQGSNDYGILFSMAVGNGDNLMRYGGYYRQNQYLGSVGTLWGGQVEKTNGNGSPIWSRNYLDSINTHSWQFLDLLVLPNSEMAVGGTYISLDSLRQPFLIKIDSNGDIIWKRYYTIPNGQCYFKKIVNGYDGSFYLFGYVNPTNGQLQAPFMLHVDEFGCLIDNCNLSDGITEQEEKLELKIFPQPASNSITIELPIPAKTSLNYELIDMNGRSVLTAGIDAHEKKVVIDVSLLVSGLYILVNPEGDFKPLKVIIQR